MGPLLALVVIGLILIGLVGAIFGGLNLVFQTIFNYFPYFVVLVILGYLVTKFGGRRGGRMSEAEAGALGAVGGAAASEIADRLGGGGGTDTTPTSPPDSPPTTTTDDSSSSDSGDVDVTVGGDNLSQQQQQQMQQLQEVVLALLEGNLGQGGGGNFVAYGPQQQQQQMFGGLSPGVYSMFMQQISMMQMNQQMMMRQMMQFFMQSDYDEINNQFILQFMQQVLDIDVDEGDVDEGDVIVQINQVVQQIDITQIEQNIEKIIQEVNITDITYIEQFMEILIAVEQGDYEREGDVIVIFAHQEIRIKAATLLTFLNILQVVKYWELKQMIVKLIDLTSESWEVKIENLIVIYRESGGDRDELNIDLSGTNWEVFLRTLEALEYNQQLKNNLLAIFRDNVNWNQQYGITTATFSSIQNAVGSLPAEDVPKAGQKLVEIVENNNENISDDVLRKFIDYIYDKWPANRSYLKNENYYQNMANDQVSERLEEIIGQIEEQEKIEKHVIQLDEDAKQALQQALEYYYQEEDFIHAVRVISTDLEDNNIAQITQDINQVNQDLGIDITNPDYAREQIEELRQIAQKLEQAVEDLKEADHELEQVESTDVQLEETLEQIEQNEVNMTQQARTVLQKIHDLS